MLEKMIDILSNVIGYLEPLLPHFTLVFTGIIYIIKFKKRVSKIALLIKAIMLICILIIIYQVFSQLLGIDILSYIPFLQ